MLQAAAHSGSWWCGSSWYIHCINPPLSPLPQHSTCCPPHEQWLVRLVVGGVAFGALSSLVFHPSQCHDCHLPSVVVVVSPVLWLAFEGPVRSGFSPFHWWAGTRTGFTSSRSLAKPGWTAMNQSIAVLIGSITSLNSVQFKPVQYPAKVGSNWPSHRAVAKNTTKYYYDIHRKI